MTDDPTADSGRNEILVVDDTPASLKLLSDLLSEQGYLVRPASSGTLALRSVAAKLPDLILLDVKMPEIDGYEVCRQLKADPHSRKVPVIFISALVETEEKIKGFKAGGVDYLTKPLEPEEVLVRVETHLKLKNLTERLEDIVHQRTAELTATNQQLQKANRAYRALSDCNQMLIRATEEQALLQETCRIVAEVCGYRLVWIGLAEQDEAKTVRPVAQAGYEQGYLETLQLSWADTARGRGPTGRAIREKTPIVTEDILHNPDFALWRDEALKRGYASSVSLPLLTAGNEALGAMTVYAAEANSFIPAEVELLQELAGDLAYGLAALQLRADHQHAEEALKESEELHRVTLSSILDPIFITDDTGHFTFIGPNVNAILGYSVEEIQALDNIARLGGDDLFRREDLITEGEIHNIERVIPDKSGREHCFLITVRRVDIKGGTILYSCHDITELKQAETDKEQLQGQLQHAQKMESVGRLAGGVAHDFNNMLGIILGNAELALNRIDPEQPLHGSLAEILKAGQRAAELTRQLLTFARKQTVSPEVLNLNEVLSNMLKMIQRLGDKEIEFIFRPAADLWPIKMDPGQVDQVLANLCINARDAIAEIGHITIETTNVVLNETFCAHHECSEPGEYVQLCVADDGCGMSAEVLDKIFEPFFTTKAVDQGTGLGLSIVYGIVKQNQGFIHVTSEPGEGTSFKIFLPRHTGESVIASAEELPPTAVSGTETVLLVDDEPALLDLVKNMLETLGYRVIAANTPGEALQLAEEHQGEIDLLLTDIVMPEMTGWDLSYQLTSRYPHIKRLLMSGHAPTKIAKPGAPEEEVDFLQKPFSLENLSIRIRESLTREE